MAYRNLLLAGSLEGKTDAIYVSVQANPNILEDIDKLLFVDTPMHVAAAKGHTNFVLEMMRLKPSFARKLNPEGFGPIHLALQNGHYNTAVKMVESDRDLVHVKGRDGVTPLDYVANLGDPELLDTFLSLEDRLKAAARSGDTDIMYSLLNEDPDLLDRIDAVPFVETPLHIAAFEGQINFAMEMMMLKPSFSLKLNKDGFTPLHLALQNQKDDMVFRLIDVDRDLVRVQGRDGETVLHVAARHGNLKLLSLFLQACPNSIQDVTSKKETVLHIAAQNDKFKAFDFLVANLRKAVHENSHSRESEILNKRDVNMDTVLHIAVKKNRRQMVQLLLDCGLVKTKLKNSQGLSPEGVLQPETPANKPNREAIQIMLSVAERPHLCEIIWRMLSPLGVPVPWEASEQTNDLHLLNRGNTQETNNNGDRDSNASQPDLEVQTLQRDEPGDYSWSKVSKMDLNCIALNRVRADMTDSTRSMVLVVLALIATAAYQSILSPPGGLMQDTNATNSTANNSQGSSRQAGKTIIPANQFIAFQNLNTLALLYSVWFINFLMPDSYSIWIPMKPIIWLFFACYVTGAVIIMPLSRNFVTPVVIVFLYICSTVLMGLQVLMDYKSKLKRSLRKGIINKFNLESDEAHGAQSADEQALMFFR